MGESNSYSVQPDVEQGPTLEEQAQAMEIKATEETEQQPQTYTQERPDWLPEKFENAEALAKAYSELESKQGQTEPTETEETPQESVSTFETASLEYAETGELSEDTYKALESQGLNRITVDNYIAGQQAILDQQQTAITNEIGGMAEYKKLSNWAAESLNDEELEAYNQTVESGTVAQAKFAINALYSRFQQAGSPKIFQGESSGTGVPPFQSRQQVTRAMSDKRYDSDPAYREEVLQRLARSNV